MDVTKIETGLVDSSTTLVDSGAVKEYVDNPEDPAAVSQPIHLAGFRSYFPVGIIRLFPSQAEVRIDFGYTRLF